MSKLEYSVWHFAQGEAGSTNITSAIDTSDKEGINMQSDIYTFNISNKNNKYADDLICGDYIEVKAGYNGSLNRLIYGKIEVEEYSLSPSNKSKLIKGAGINRELQNYNVQQIIQSGANYTVGDYVYDYTKINSRNVFKLLIQEFINANDSIPTDIDWETYVDISSGTLPWAQTVGSDFFKAWANKKVREVINEIRGDTYTGNGDYDFYIDNNYKAHFEPTGQSLGAYSLTEGSNILSYKLKRDIKPAFTVATIFLGNDDSDIPIQTQAVNSYGLTQYGWKEELFNWGNYFSNIKKNNPSGANAAWRTLAIKQGKKDAQSFVDREGLPKWKGNINIKGTHEFSVISGTYLNISLPSITANLNPGSLILNSVTNDITTKGWVTKLDVIEKLGEVFSG